MSTLLWQKNGVKTDAAVMRFLAGDDVVLDRELFPFDIRATAAHAETSRGASLPLAARSRRRGKSAPARNSS